VQTFSAETSKEIFGSPITKHALFFTSLARAEEHAAVMSAVTTVAGAYRGVVLFVNVPHTESKISEFFGISESSLPALVIADMSGEGMKKYFYPGSLLSSDEISVFVDTFLSGALRPSLKSEDVLTEDTEGPVVVVKAFSFDDLVIDNTKDVFVEFYAPW